MGAPLGNKNAAGKHNGRSRSPYAELARVNRGHIKQQKQSFNAGVKALAKINRSHAKSVTGKVRRRK